MVVYQLECAGCGEERIGLETDDGVRPVRDACSECGGTEYDVLAYDSDDPEK